MRITIVGRGRVGRGLYHALARSPLDVTLHSSHRAERARAADVFVLAVADPAYEAVATSLASGPCLSATTRVLHCSGSRAVSALAPCRASGAAIGAMHPLVSFTRRPPALEGTTFVIAGDPKAVQSAKLIARGVGARPVIRDVHGPAYHAAAALSANGSAALATLGVRVLEQLGFSSREATRAIGALLRSVADNVEAVGVPDALSGPILRGDAKTVTDHREALRNIDRDALRAYDAIGPTILEVARANGLPETRVRAVARALRGPRKS